MINGITLDQVKDLTDKRNNFYERGNYWLKRSEDLIWYQPDLPHADLDKECWLIAVTSASLGTPASKLVHMIITAISLYIVDCIQKRVTIKSCLNYSAHHFEMYGFYDEILRTGTGRLYTPVKEQ